MQSKKDNSKPISDKFHYYILLYFLFNMSSLTSNNRRTDWQFMMTARANPNLGESCGRHFSPRRPKLQSPGGRGQD
uniref:Uncharacterized protein n=1 Tax=Lepeophtheirus salmonis TaxID=72036 RepID=A0A0K2TUY7_LEPSM